MKTREQTASTLSKRDVQRLVAEIDTELRSRANPDRAEHEKAYLKSELIHHGTTVPAIRSVTKSVARQCPI